MKDPETLTYDAKLEAVGREKRRRLLYALRNDGSESESPVDVRDLDYEGEDSDPVLAMYHVHVPKLVAMDVVAKTDEYRVTRGENFGEVEPLLGRLEGVRGQPPIIQ